MKLSEAIAPVFYPVWQDLREGGHQEYWLMGGRGSGKSSFVSLAIVHGMLKNPAANAIVYRKVAATLRESVFEQLNWAIQTLQLTDFFDLKRSPLEITIPRTGQRILFRGADDPMKSKSIKLSQGYFGYLWFEELAEFASMDDIRTIKASILRGEGKTATFFTYNPPRTPGSWVNREALIPREDRLTHASTYLDLPASWLGQTFLSEAEALKIQNERAYRHMYLGEITGTGGQVFDNLELRPIRANEIDALGAFFYGLDFGFASDPDAFTHWGYDKKSRRLYALNEFIGRHLPAEDLAEAIRTRCGREIVWADNEDPRMIAALNRLGVRAIPAQKGPGSVRAGLRFLQELSQIVIDPMRTPEIAREFLEYEYLPDRMGGFLPETPDRNNHTIDSCRYALHREIFQKTARTRNDIY